MRVLRPNGQPESYVDELGNCFSYDESGTLTRLETASGDVTLYRADGTPEKTTRLDGTTDYYQVDGSTRRVSAQGQLIQIVTANGANRAVLQGDGTWRGEEPDGTVFRFRADGTPLERTDGDGTVTAFALDGTVAATSLDGTVTTTLVDGTVTVQPLGGDPTVYHSDGTVEVQRGDTTFLTLPDGSTETRYPGGTRVVEGTDRTITTYLPGGSIVTRDAYGRVFQQADAEAAKVQYSVQGTLTINLEGGLTLRWVPSGTMQIVRPGDPTRELHPGGRVTETAADDTVTVHHVTGAIEIQRPDGSREYTHVDGTQVVLGAGGSLSTTLPDGSTLRRASSFLPTVLEPAEGSAAIRNVDGSVTLAEEGGGTWTWLADGRLQVAYDKDITVWATDGTVQETWSDEPATTTITTDADGTRVAVDADDVTTIESFDGSWTTTRPDGSGQARFVDGATSKWDADGTRYDLAADGKTLTTTLSDHSVVVRAADGSVQGTPAQGSTLLTKNAADQWTASLSGGTMVTWTHEGTLITTSPDGKVVRQAVSGEVVVESPDGTVWVRTPEGRVTQTGVDGSVTVQTPEGARIAALATGRVQTVTPDGVTRRADVDGALWTWSDDTTVRERLTGERTVWLADGTREESLPGGVTVSQAWDGPSTYRFQDGSLVTVAADGTLTPQLASGSTTVRVETDGTVVATLPDTSELRLAPGGERRLTAADGTLSVRLADGTFSTTASGVTTTWSPVGDVTRQIGARRTVWEASTGRTITYENNTMVELVEANGIHDEYLPGGNVRTTFPAVGSNPPVVLENGRTPLVQAVPHGGRTLAELPTRPIIPDDPEVRQQLAAAFKAGDQFVSIAMNAAQSGWDVVSSPFFWGEQTSYSSNSTTWTGSNGEQVHGPIQVWPPGTWPPGPPPAERWEVTALHKARCCDHPDCYCCQAGIPDGAVPEPDPTTEHSYTLHFAQDSEFIDLGPEPVTDPETGEETGDTIWTFRVKGQLYWSDAPPGKRRVDSGFVQAAWEGEDSINRRAILGQDMGVPGSPADIGAEMDEDSGSASGSQVGLEAGPPVEVAQAPPPRSSSTSLPEKLHAGRIAKALTRLTGHQARVEPTSVEGVAMVTGQVATVDPSGNPGGPCKYSMLVVNLKKLSLEPWLAPGLNEKDPTSSNFSGRKSPEEAAATRGAVIAMTGTFSYDADIGIKSADGLRGPDLFPVGDVKTSGRQFDSADIKRQHAYLWQPSPSLSIWEMGMSRKNPGGGWDVPSSVMRQAKYLIAGMGPLVERGKNVGASLLHWNGAPSGFQSDQATSSFHTALGFTGDCDLALVLTTGGVHSQLGVRADMMGEMFVQSKAESAVLLDGGHAADVYLKGRGRIDDAGGECPLPSALLFIPRVI